jgi:hypothetical protein
LQGLAYNKWFHHKMGYKVFTALVTFFDVFLNVKIANGHGKVAPFYLCGIYWDNTQAQFMPQTLKEGLI